MEKVTPGLTPDGTLTVEEIQIGKEAAALVRAGRPVNRKARRAYDRKVEQLRRRLVKIQAERDAHQRG